MNRLLDLVGASPESVDRFALRLSASVSIFAIATAALLAGVALLK